jgi:hypothetical protein
MTSLLSARAVRKTYGRGAFAAVMALTAIPAGILARQSAAVVLQTEAA